MKRTVKVRNDQEMAQSERIPNDEVGKKQTDNQILIQRPHIISQESSYFPTCGHSITRS